MSLVTNAHRQYSTDSLGLGCANLMQINMWKVIVSCALVFQRFSFVSCEERKPPNIITILADDLGWNDVSFHGSNQIPTPNIDALAYNGIILNSHYVQPLCTPSRAAFLTGKYPIHTGMQHSVILETEPRGLPINEKILPQYLKESGYATHAVGKWHLGFFRREYTPTFRGFDTHYGYWNGFQDYFNQSVVATFNSSVRGLDLHRNLDVDYKSVGKYSTHLYTEEAVRLIDNHNKSKPLFIYMAHLAPHTGNIGNAFQAPDEEIAKFSHIADPERRVYAAMVSVLDHSVGEIMAALRRNGMLDNSIVLFMSDNGAPTHGLHSNRGSNYPLRGQKDSPWEGGTRGVAAVWSSMFKNTKKVSNQIMHISDWLPTFWSALGRDYNELGEIDGISMWETLTEDKPSSRHEFVVNMDELSPYSSIRFNEWKYISGKPSYGDYDEWYGETGINSSPYEPFNVLLSKTCVAITGYITEKQMAEMRANNGILTQSVVPLQMYEIGTLRDSATINCTRSSNECNPKQSPCLFNLIEDPCESYNLALEKPVLLASLQDLVNKYQTTVVKAGNLPPDPRADPALFGNVWSNWLDDPVSPTLSSNHKTALYIVMFLCVVLGLGIAVAVCIKVRKMECYKGTLRSDSFTLKSKGNSFFRTFSMDSQRRRSHAREAAMSPSITVAQRVEMIEDKDIYKSRI